MVALTPLGFRLTNANLLAGGLLVGTGVDMTKKVHYYDFNQNALDATVLTANLAGTGTATWTLTDMGTYVRIYGGAAGGNAGGFLGKSLYQTGSFSTIVFETQVRFTADITTLQDLGIGISADNYAGYVGGGAASGIGLGWNGTAWKFVTTNAGGADESDTITWTPGTTWHRIRIEITSTGTAVKLFIDGTQVGTTHATTLPATTAQLHVNYLMRADAGTSASQYMDVRSFRVVLLP